MIKWLKRRKAEKERQQYMDGFGWAMTAFYVEKLSIGGIKRQLDIGADFDGFGNFESGARYAVRILSENPKNGGA